MRGGEKGEGGDRWASAGVIRLLAVKFALEEEFLRGREASCEVGPCLAPSPSPAGSRGLTGCLSLFNHLFPTCSCGSSRLPGCPALSTVTYALPSLWDAFYY